MVSSNILSFSTMPHELRLVAAMLLTFFADNTLYVIIIALQLIDALSRIKAGFE